MSRYLYLVRHGEQQDAQYGLPDGPLSPRGIRQAHAIAERLGGVPFTGAWTSPLVFVGISRFAPPRLGA